MSVYKNIFILSLLFFIVAISGYFFIDDSKVSFDEETGVYDSVQHFKYSFNLKNITPRALTDAQVWMSAPLALNPNQKILSISANKKITLFRDENYNQEMHFNFKGVDKGSVRQVAVDIEMALATTANIHDENNLDKYLLSDQFILVNDPIIKNKAQALQSDDPYKSNINILNFLKELKAGLDDSSANEVVVDVEVANAGKANQTNNVLGIESKATVLDVLNNKQGSEIGFLYLYLSLNRALGIPSRAVVGFDVTATKQFNADDAKLWVEYYSGTNWHVVNLESFSEINDTTKFIAFKILTEMPTSEDWQPYSVLYKQTAFVVDESSVRFSVY